MRHANRLIQEPPVQHDIHGAIRGPDLNRAKNALPVFGDVSLHSIEVCSPDSA